MSSIAPLVPEMCVETDLSSPPRGATYAEVSQIHLLNNFESGQPVPQPQQ